MAMKGFSEFEFKESAIRLNSDDAEAAAAESTDEAAAESTDEALSELLTSFVRIGCVGTISQVLNTKTITKKCEGVVTKKRTKHAGDGELKVSLFMQWKVYKILYGMVSNKLKKGVIGYGNGRHPEFTLVGKALDEDGLVKYKAYPNCVISDGPSPSTDNSSEEVAEIEVTIGVSADANGFCLYEALEDELEDTENADIKDKWMTEFTPNLVAAETETSE